MPIMEIVIVLGLLTLTEILRVVVAHSKWPYLRRDKQKNKR